jgi:hypothetical protein
VLAVTGIKQGRAMTQITVGIQQMHRANINHVPQPLVLLTGPAEAGAVAQIINKQELVTTQMIAEMKLTNQMNLRLALLI